MGSLFVSGPRTFRFRTDRDSDAPTGERCWKARYSYESGWAPFEIRMDFDKKALSIIRAPGIPYGGLLCDLVERLMGVETSSAPLVKHPSNVLTIPCRVIGYDMSRHADTGGGVPVSNGIAGYFRDDPPGAWLVVRASCPDQGASFLLAINDRRGSGEIVSERLEDSMAVVEAFTDVFADSRTLGGV